MTCGKGLHKKRNEPLGLFLIDGEMPGVDFRGVSFKGSLLDLNAALREEGLSIIVERL